MTRLHNELTQPLLNWYKKNARDLPWRKMKDPYKIWISEVMLQQTTVKAVIPYYLKWIKKYPTIKRLANAKQIDVLNTWQGLGYYQRVKNLRRSAEIVLKEYGGKLPAKKKVLSSLPGFGPYTTGAVMSIAFNKAVVIIDANIRRIIMRLLAIKKKTNAQSDAEVSAFLEKVISHRLPGAFNQALMELGALICRSKNPFCLRCPVINFCQAYKQNIQELIPTPKKVCLKNVEAVVAVIEHGKKYLIQKRPHSGLLADLWEFPGGKVKKRETFVRALKREIKEELSCDILSSTFLMRTNHYYTQFKVKLHVWKVRLAGQLDENKNRRWVKAVDLIKYPMPAGSAKIVQVILNNKY